MAHAVTPDTPVQATLSVRPVRRVRFRYGEQQPMRHFFADGDIVLSHLMAMPSAVFPPGGRHHSRTRSPDLEA
jgi:hypothetical protein